MLLTHFSYSTEVVGLRTVITLVNFINILTVEYIYFIIYKIYITAFKFIHNLSVFIRYIRGDIISMNHLI